MAWALRWHSKSLLIGLLRVVTLMVSRVNRLLSGPGCDASPILETETGKHPAWHEFKKNLDAFMQMRQMHLKKTHSLLHPSRIATRVVSGQADTRA